MEYGNNHVYCMAGRLLSLDEMLFTEAFNSYRFICGL